MQTSDQYHFEQLLKECSKVAEKIGEEIEIEESEKKSLFQQVQIQGIEALMCLKEQFGKKKRDQFENEVRQSQGLQKIVAQISKEHAQEEKKRLSKIQYRVVQQGIPSKMYEKRLYQNSVIPQEDFNKQQITIMMIGETGCGKSTLINTIGNYILGVNMEDPFRYQIVSDPSKINKGVSQTDEVVEYYFPDVGKGITLVLLDSPGFGDTRGLKQDELNKQFIYKKMKEHQEVQAICFVFKATETRATKHAMYINDQVLKMFGKEASKNIFIMFTFSHSDSSRLEQQTGVGIVKNNLCTPHEGYYFFDNKAINDLSCGDQKSINQILWNFNYKNLEEFFNKLKNIKPLKLDSSIQVFDERQKIESFLDRMFSKLKTFMKVKSDVEKAKTDILNAKNQKDANAKYEIIKKEYEKVFEKADTYCFKCYHICHADCSVFSDYKGGCWAFSGDYCRQCPGRCHVSDHKLGPNTKFRQEEKNSVTIDQNLKNAYDQNSQKEQEANSRQNVLSSQVTAIEQEAQDYINTIQGALKKLNQIALKPSEDSTEDYINEIIKTVKDSNPPDKEEQLAFLEDLKKKAAILVKIQQGEKNVLNLIEKK